MKMWIGFSGSAAASYDTVILPHRTANRSAAFPYLYQDIHAPIDLLPQLAASRHWNHELILLTTNWQQYDLAVNLVAGLHRLGLDHYVLLGDNDQLVRHAARRGAVAAVWSSLLDRYIRPVSGGDSCPLSCSRKPPPSAFGLQRSSQIGERVAYSERTKQCHLAQDKYCLPGAASYYKVDAVRRLWLLRFFYTERLVRLGYNVMLLDSDSIVLANPYPLINRRGSRYK